MTKTKRDDQGSVWGSLVFVAILALISGVAWRWIENQAPRLDTLDDTELEQLIDDLAKQICVNPACDCYSKTGDPCTCEKCECNLAPERDIRIVITGTLNSKEPAEVKGVVPPDIKEIVMFTRANCPACDQWLAQEWPKFQKEGGWKIAFHTWGPNEGGLAPSFLVYANQKQYDFPNGTCTLQTVKARLAQNESR